jgi:hypothetical protein
VNHPNLNIPVRVAIGLIALRLVLFFVNGDFPYQEEIYLFLNLTAIPALVIYAIWPRGDKSDFIKSVGASMRSAMLYGFIMAIFTFLYYTFIDVDYFPNKRDEIIERQLLALDGTEDPAVVSGKINDFFSVRNLSVLALLLYILLSAFYAFLFSALKQVFLRSRSA